MILLLGFLGFLWVQKEDPSHLVSIVSIKDKPFGVRPFRKRSHSPTPQFWKETKRFDHLGMILETPRVSKSTSGWGDPKVDPYKDHSNHPP